MKVLFISGGKGADYQNDVVFHGLRSLLGSDCVDVAKMNFMYENWHEYMFHSLYRLLPDIEVDREDIGAKIQSHYFDAVVYGSVHRCREYIDAVQKSYPPSQIAFIDGEDGPELAPAVGHGWYFKRELYTPNPDVLPIQFGIPKEKIRPIDRLRKTRLMAHCDPRDRSTYQYYDSEARYYDQYSDAWFGYTMKKGGWDCMRHVEIMAAGCLPYFENLDNCPEGTLYYFNRSAFKEARYMHDTGDLSGWNFCAEFMQTNLREFMTTEAISKRVLDRLR